jgi:hypothetical protein
MRVTNCLTCNTELRGRADKKFCDDQCRTTFNNQQKAEPPFVKEITSALKKNRRIMEGLIPVDTGKIKVSQQKLLAKGFNFAYHTHTYTTKVGTHYTFCYEYGYLKIDNDYYMLVKRITD